MRAKKYAEWVLDPANEKRTGRLIKLAAQRFISDLDRTDIYFDEKEAARFITFAETCCCLWEDKWRGQPVTITPWMAFIFEQIYGWFRTDSRLRRVRKVYVQVAKKNGKSSLAGVMALFHLFADERIKTPKVFVGANNEDQAKICVNISGKILTQSPDLYEYVDDGQVDIFQYKENIVNIVHRERDGFIKAMAKETESKTSKQAGGKHGFNPSLGLIDEYAMADSASLLDALESAQAAREEPLMFAITTAGHKKDGPCFTQLRRTGIEVLEGTIEDDSYLPFIYEYDKGDDYTNEEIWEKCNPNLGVSVFHEFLKARVRAAQYEGGSKAVDVRTLNFNEWCDTPEVWIGKETWDKCNYGEGDLTGECFGGIEIVSGLSLNALVLCFPGEKLTIKPLYWMPSLGFVENKDKADFSKWKEHIIACEGNVVDNQDIFDILFEELKKYNLHSIAIPGTLQQHDLIQAFIRNGITCNPISQGYAGLSTPTKLWEELVTSGQVNHMGHPVLTWNNGNCMVKRLGNEIRVEKSGGRTVGVTAAVMALAQWKTIEATKVDDYKLESW